jgi:hypothetical protein
MQTVFSNSAIARFMTRLYVNGVLLRGRHSTVLAIKLFPNSEARRIAETIVRRTTRKPNGSSQERKMFVEPVPFFAIFHKKSKQQAL